MRHRMSLISNRISSILWFLLTGIIALTVVSITTLATLQGKLEHAVQARAAPGHVVGAFVAPRSALLAAAANVSWHQGWSQQTSDADWVSSFASNFEAFWRGNAGHVVTFCPAGQQNILSNRTHHPLPGLECLLTDVGFELSPDVVRPMYVMDDDGKLQLNQERPHLEPYSCLTHQLAVDYGALTHDMEGFDYEGYGMSPSSFSHGAFRFGNCHDGTRNKAGAEWHVRRQELSARCFSAQIKQRLSKVFAALEIGDQEISCSAVDKRLTIFVVRPSVWNLWEAHFALVETLLRITALGLLPLLFAEGNDLTQAVLLPPDPANVGRPGASLELWRQLIGGRVVAARDISPRATVCYERAALVVDFCCEAHNLCPSSLSLPSARRDASRQSALAKLMQFSCMLHAGLAGCAYSLLRHRMLSSSNLSSSSSTSTPLTVVLVSRRTARDRHILNEDALLRELPAALPNSAQVRLVDFAALPVAQHVKIVGTSNILAGVHGAGLTNMLFLPPTGAVAEIALQTGWKNSDGEPQGSPNMFAEMAHRLGLSYTSWLYDGTLDKHGHLNVASLPFTALLTRALELLR